VVVTRNYEQQRNLTWKYSWRGSTRLPQVAAQLIASLTPAVCYYILCSLITTVSNVNRFQKKPGHQIYDTVMELSVITYCAVLDHTVCSETYNFRIMIKAISETLNV